jgi:Dna[CI] antecedent DciA-like protein
MHKKPRPYKKSGARNGNSAVTHPIKTLQINDLLSKRPSLARLTEAVPAQQAWVQWFRSALPADLAAHVVNVVPRSAATSGRATELVIFADSAAWGTRLRYALAALDSRIRARDAAVGGWRVRIAPAGGESPRL